MKHFVTIIISIFLVFGIAGSVFATSHSRTVTPTVGEGDYTSTVSEGDYTPTVVPTPIIVENPIKADSIQELFKALIDILLVFAIPIIAFFIIYAGFMYVTARGNAEQIETAHKALLYALVGGVLILGAWALVAVIEGTINDIRGALIIIPSLIA